MKDLSLYKISETDEGDTYVAAESYEAALKLWRLDDEERFQPEYIAFVDGDLLIQEPAAKESSIGKAIRIARANRGVSQGTVASEIGITQATLSALENEKRNPTDRTRQKVADWLKAQPSP